MDLTKIMLSKRWQMQRYTEKGRTNLWCQKPRAWVSPLKTVDFFLALELVISICPLWKVWTPIFKLLICLVSLLYTVFLTWKGQQCMSTVLPQRCAYSSFLLRHSQQGFLPPCYPADHHPGHDTDAVIFIAIVLTRKWFSEYLSKTNTHCRRWEIRLTKANGPATTILNFRL